MFRPAEFEQYVDIYVRTHRLVSLYLWPILIVLKELHRSMQSVYSRLQQAHLCTSGSKSKEWENMVKSEQFGRLPPVNYVLAFCYSWRVTTLLQSVT